MYLRTVVFICECTICLFIGNSVASSITGLSERFKNIFLHFSFARKWIVGNTAWNLEVLRNVIRSVSVNMLRLSLSRNKLFWGSHGDCHHAKCCSVTVRCQEKSLVCRSRISILELKLRLLCFTPPNKIRHLAYILPPSPTTIPITEEH